MISNQRVLLSSPGSVKRSFDRFVNDRIQRIDEYRPRTGEKVGILWFVKQFDDLAQLAETIFDKAERRTDLDRAYKKFKLSKFLWVEF